MSIRRLGALLAAALAAAPLLARATPAGLAFASHQVFRGELESTQTYAAPLAVGPGTTPAIYVAGPGQDRIWRSADLGATWSAKATPSEFNLGAEIAADANGAVYLSRNGGHYLFPIVTSLDGGSTWGNGSYLGRGLPPCDGTHWTSATGNGRVVVVANCIGPDCCAWTSIYGWVSSNSGQTYTKVILARNVEETFETGPAAFAGPNQLYVPYADENSLYILKSADGGLTWTSTKLADVGSDTIDGFPVVESDDAGNVYVAWSKTGTPFLLPGQVFLARSTDGGATWLTPIVIPDAVGQPQLSAGSAGRIAITYFSGGAIEVVESVDATTGVPTFTRDSAVAALPIDCILCSLTGPLDTEIDDAGNLYVGYSIGYGFLPPGDLYPFHINNYGDVMVAVQTAGQRLRTP